MCAVCGCGGSAPHIELAAGGGNPLSGLLHQHDHDPVADQESAYRMVQVELDILHRNNQLAALNRHYFNARRILALNLVSGPGSGKTSLLVSTVASLQNDFPVAVIEGDQQTDHDAERIRSTGVDALQINTGKGCHLDGRMIGKAINGLQPREGSVLFIENVGNLVCPAVFDLGEAHKIVILSVTEGSDKPLKYPDIFHAADLVILNKIDLLPYVDFDVEYCISCARRVKPDIEVLALSATTGVGMHAWYDWIRRHRQLLQQAACGGSEVGPLPCA